MKITRVRTLTASEVTPGMDIEVTFKMHIQVLKVSKKEGDDTRVVIQDVRDKDSIHYEFGASEMVTELKIERTVKARQ